MLLRPPGRLPTHLGISGLLVVTALLAVGTEGAALLVLLGGLVALPAISAGRERLAFWAWTAGGSALFLLALLLFSCHQIDRLTTTDPLWNEGNHETGFMLLLLGLGIALPGAITGALFGAASRAVVRAQRAGTIDAVDRALWAVALAGALAGDVLALGFSVMHLHAGAALLALPALSVAGLGAAAWVGRARLRRVEAAYAGRDERLRVEDGASDAPPIAALPGVELEATLVEAESTHAEAYRQAAPAPRALARVPRSPEALFSAWRRRWIGATIAAAIQAGAATLLSLEMARRYGWLR